MQLSVHLITSRFSVTKKSNGTQTETLYHILPFMLEEFRCPRPAGHFPDPEDCFKFYQCDFNVAHHMPCAPGTGFDASLSVCNYPGAIACEARQRESEPDNSGGRGG